MEAMAASPIIRRETSKLRRQALQFSASMTLKESPSRVRRCATPWQMEFGHSLQGPERSISSSSSCSSFTHGENFGASVRHSPSSVKSTDSEGGDSLDSFLEESMATQRSRNRCSEHPVEFWHMGRASQGNSTQRSKSSTGSWHTHDIDSLEELQKSIQKTSRHNCAHLALDL